jgi:hypothetical protein
MYTVKNKTKVSVSAFLLSLLLAPEAFPCTCIIHNHRTDFRRAKAVFVGKVIDIDKNRPIPERLSGDAIHSSAKFNIEKTWKGSCEADKELKQLGSFWFRLFARVNPF